MDYHTAVTTEFIPRMTAALNSIRDGLIAAGVSANNVTVGEIDSVDLRYQITASRAGRTLTAYVELTDSLRLGSPVGESKAILTLFAQGSTGGEITTAYSAGTKISYMEEAGIDALLAKLAQIEAAVPELIVKARAYLRV